jgi:small-conductance mechanosensitive channel
VSEWLTENLGLSERLQGRLAASLVTIAVLLLVRWLILRAVTRTTEEAQVVFRVRKATTYLTTVVTVILLARIWIDAFDNVGTFLGLLSAGIAIALADVFLNLAGWAYILVRQPFKIGDRIEIGATAGDVIDIRVFRFSLLEIGNWVDADQSTGRILHVPNGLLFRQAMANFTQGFPHIWHEIPMLITFESDWELAEQMFRGVLDGHAMNPRQVMAEEDIRRASRQYYIQYSQLTPTVYVTVRDSGVLLTGRLLVPVRSRRGVDSDIWKELLVAIAGEPRIELAYPTVRTYLPDTLHVERRASSESGPELPGSDSQ